jgi:hypothetical protein
VRPGPDAELQAVLVLGTLGAPERRFLGGRRPRELDRAEPEPVPTTRATVVRPEPFRSLEQASAWLDGRRRDRDAAQSEVDAALGVLNRALRAQRAAAADPYVGDLSAARALALRIGYGRGDALADGRFREALELPAPGRRRSRRSMEAPEERFAALLGGREQVLLGEEHVLRARADLNAGRLREAALEARVALEGLLAELDDPTLAEQRDRVRAAAADALARNDPGAAHAGGDPNAVEQAVAAMEAALRRHRLRA